MMGKIRRTALGDAVEWEEDDTPFEVRSFNLFGKHPHLWLEQSLSLNRAAIALMRPEAMWCKAMTPQSNAPIALMLGSYAVETLLKMIILADKLNEIEPPADSRQSKEFLPKSHDLVDLAKRSKLLLNEADRALMKELTKYSIWAGRYPTPLRSAGYRLPAIFEHENNPSWPLYEPLYEKLYKLAVRKTFKEELAFQKKRRKRRERLNPSS
jgi:hypothetical protein